MVNSDLTEWLLENGGPAVRYRTTRELLEDPTGIDTKRLETELLASKSVRLWLDQLVPGNFGLSDLHGSKSTAFENAIGKLAELGLRAGMSPVDKRTLPFRKWFKREARRPENTLSLFCRSLVASGLLRAGYDEEPLRPFLDRRLDVLYETARDGRYDIYIDQNTFGDYPKARCGHPLINPEFYPGGNFRLPWIHDIYALSSFPKGLTNASVRKKISVVITYILHLDYQALHDGYGVFRADKRRYYAMGWDVKLPGYNGFDLDDFQAGYFVQRLELIAHFPSVRQHRWFKESIKHLDTFRTEHGTWLLPRRYLPEKRVGYYVCGAHMGLEEKRRSDKAIEIESTFRMLKIRKLARIRL